MTAALFGGELVPSVSIENMLNQRSAVIARLSQVLDQIDELHALARRAHVGIPNFCLCTGYSGKVDWRLSGDYKSERHAVEAAVLKDIDRSAWAYLMNESGMRSLMDATARKDWDEALDKGKFPELTQENIEATFSQLHGSRQEIFERGVIHVFKSLNWDYKTNRPFAFGKRIIITYLLHTYSNKQFRSLASFNHRTIDQVDDLIRVFSIMDGKPEPDHRSSIRETLVTAQHAGKNAAAHAYFDLKWYLNGNGHLTFKRPDLVDRMNAILARHYPGALPHDRKNA